MQILGGAATSLRWKMQKVAPSANAVGELSRHLENPGKEQWKWMTAHDQAFREMKAIKTVLYHLPENQQGYWLADTRHFVWGWI